MYAASHAYKRIFLAACENYNFYRDEINNFKATCHAGQAVWNFT